MGPVLLADEEAEESASLSGAVIANGSSEHGIVCFESVQNPPERKWRGNLESNLFSESRQRAQMVGAYDTNG